MVYLCSDTHSPIPSASRGSRRKVEVIKSKGDVPEDDRRRFSISIELVQAIVNNTSCSHSQNLPLCPKMPPNQHHHPEYAPPVLRAPSPASSVGTSYGADQTSFSDSEHQLSQVAFERKWEDRIGLGNPSIEEETANLGPLLERPVAGSPEEKGEPVS